MRGDFWGLNNYVVWLCQVKGLLIIVGAYNRAKELNRDLLMLFRIIVAVLAALFNDKANNGKNWS